jgi:hypothetical protein
VACGRGRQSLDLAPARGIVDQDLDGPEGRFGGVEEGDWRSGIAQVGFRSFGVAARAANSFDDSSRVLRSVDARRVGDTWVDRVVHAKVRHQNPSAVLRQSPSGVRADAMVAASDDGDAPVDSLVAQRRSRF